MSTHLVIQLFEELMNKNTPDLYQSEWKLIYKSLLSNSEFLQIPESTQQLKEDLIVSLEDLGDDALYVVNPFELSEKLAGFSDVSLCSTFFHIHKAAVAAKEGQEYSFPEIRFKNQRSLKSDQTSAAKQL